MFYLWLAVGLGYFCFEVYALRNQKATLTGRAYGAAQRWPALPLVLGVLLAWWLSRDSGVSLQ